MIRINNLGFRLTLVLGFLLSGFIGLLVYLLTVNHRNELLNEITFNTHRLAESVKTGIGYDMLDHKQQDVHRTIHEIGTQKGIEKIRIFSSVGKVVSSSDDTEVGTMVDKKSEACFQCHAGETPLANLQPPKGSRIFYNQEGQRILAVIKVIHNEEACSIAACHAHPKEQGVLGVLDIAVSLDEMDHRLARSTLMIIIGSSLFVLSICSLIGLLTYKFVRKPLNRLLEGIHSIARGDFDHSIAIGSSDEIGQLMVAYNDMTDKLRYHIRKLTEKQEQLLHSQKLASLGKMASGVAHELNSPLTVILNDSSLLLRKFPNGSKEKEDLEVIVGEAKRCGKIVHNLLEFTRIEKPEKKLININDLIQETLELIKHQAVLGNINVTLDLARELPQVRIDGNQIKQVFLDIISNAIHAMYDSGYLTIKSNFSQDQNHLEVDFIDTGCGISEENINKIFQPFFTTKDSKVGTGLGLAICYEIIQEHSGTIEVTSTVNKGTTFSVMLPVTQVSDAKRGGRICQKN